MVLRDFIFTGSSTVDGWYGRPNPQVKSQNHFCVGQKNFAKSAPSFEAEKYAALSPRPPRSHHRKTTPKRYLLPSPSNARPIASPQPEIRHTRHELAARRAGGPSGRTASVLRNHLHHILPQRQRAGRARVVHVAAGILMHLHPRWIAHCRNLAHRQHRSHERA